MNSNSVSTVVFCFVLNGGQIDSCKEREGLRCDSPTVLLWSGSEAAVMAKMKHIENMKVQAAEAWTFLTTLLSLACVLWTSHRPG